MAYESGDHAKLQLYQKPLTNKNGKKAVVYWGEKSYFSVQIMRVRTNICTTVCAG